MLVLAMLLIATGVQCSRPSGPQRMNTNRVELKPGELPAGGAAIVVAAADAGATPAERYRSGARSGASLAAGRRLVALVRTGPLSTPDTCEVSDAARDGNTFRLTLDMRRYTGPISANVERELLVEADLGALSPGHYTVVVTTTALEFQDRQHPERTANPSKTEERIDFDVR